jgi:outer membrane protein assembly factor BamB
LDSNLELLIEFHWDPHYILLDAKTGEQVGTLTKSSIKDTSNCYADLADNDGMELIYLIDNTIYVVDINTGKTIWYTSNSKFGVDIIDYNNDNKPEIIAYSNDIISILNGENGELIKEKIMKFDNEQLNLNHFSSKKVLDIDKDNDLELIGAAYDELYVFDLDTGEIEWRFTSGEGISYFEAKNTDSDDTMEIVIIAGNKVYSVEYFEGMSKYGNSFWTNKKLIAFSTIIIPLLITLIIILSVSRYFGSPRKRK